MTQRDQIEAFAHRLEAEQLTGLAERRLDCEANRANSRTRIVQGSKYTKVNVGPSGKYMVEHATGNIYGIKAYGVIHRGHQYGTLETLDEWNWRGYVASPHGITV